MGLIHTIIQDGIKAKKTNQEIIDDVDKEYGITGYDMIEVKRTIEDWRKDLNIDDPDGESTHFFD